VDAAETAVAAPVAEALPETLDAFVAWRLGDAAPEAGGLSPRLAPTGPADAEWVLVTDVPEAEDSDLLLSGPAGRLLDKMLAAIGLSRESVYLLPLAWARPVTGRIAPDDEARLIELARHHLSLLGPKRLFLLGQSASRVLPETKGGGPDNRIHERDGDGIPDQLDADQRAGYRAVFAAIRAGQWPTRSSSSIR
jgi:uracil-DNA glycosylase